MAKTDTRSTRPKATTTRTAKPGARESQASKGIRKAGELLQNPLVRNIIGAGIVTAVATRTAKKSARKAAREEVQEIAVERGGIESPGAVIGSALATVASEAARRLVSKGTKKRSGTAGKRAAGGASTGASKPKPKAKSSSGGTGSGQSKSTTSGSSKRASKSAGSKSKTSGSKAPARTRAGTKKSPAKKTS